jgi:predicted Zn-dependent protease
MHVRRLGVGAALAALAWTTFQLSACRAKPDFGQPPPAEILSPRTRHVVVEVDYAVGSEPYTARIGTLGPAWTILRKNLLAVFADRDVTVTVPETLDHMQPLTDVSRAGYTEDDVLDIAVSHRDLYSTPGTVTFYVVFLPGAFDDGNAIDPDTLAVTVGSTGVIAMFKPPTSPSGGAATEAEFFEQSTLVHELGHAIGLVNDGVAMAAPHQDTSNGPHCQNPNCVMYWDDVGAISAMKFLSHYRKTGSAVLFGDECMADFRALSSR